MKSQRKKYKERTKVEGKTNEAPQHNQGNANEELKFRKAYKKNGNSLAEEELTEYAYKKNGNSGNL